MSAWDMVGEIGRMILVMSVIGGVVILLLLAVKPFVRSRLPKTVQYYMWAVAIVALLVLFSAFVSISVRTPITYVKEKIDVHVMTTHELFEQRAEAEYDSSFDDLEAHEQVEIIYRDNRWWMNNVLLAALAVNGFAAFFGSYINYLSYTSKLRRSRTLPAATELALLHELAGAGIKHLPRLFRSKLAPTPMLVGILRPTIYLPDGEYSVEQLRYVFLHELTHLRRFDVVVKWLATLAVHIHWFNPLVYLMRREIDRTCELACDEAVTSNLNREEKQLYGDTLIALASDKKLSKIIMSTTMSQEKKTLKERLASIMESKSISRTVKAFSFVLIILLLGSTVALASTAMFKPSTFEPSTSEPGSIESGSSESSSSGPSTSGPGSIEPGSIEPESSESESSEPSSIESGSFKPGSSKSSSSLVGADYAVGDILYDTGHIGDEDDKDILFGSECRITAEYVLYKKQSTADTWEYLGVLEPYPLNAKELKKYTSLSGGWMKTYRIGTISETYILRLTDDYFYLVSMNKKGTVIIGYGWEDIGERGQGASDDTNLLTIYQLK